jgi:hypothetical protein
MAGAACPADGAAFSARVANVMAQPYSIANSVSRKAGKRCIEYTIKRVSHYYM